MGPKKNSKVILTIIILLVILILIVGVAYTCLATDMFKSNKELFFKYVTQMGESKEGFIENQLQQYFEKQKNTPYTNEGSFALNIADENGNQEEYESINNFNISFAGKTDKTKKTEEQEVSINYSNDVTFPINYRKIDNTVGLQTKYVSNKYVAVEMDQLENSSYEALESIEELQTSAGKLEELAQMPFSEEDWKKIQENIKKVLNEQLQDSQFVKIEENKQKGYKIDLEGKQLKNIIIQLLEMLKNDESTLEKLNEYAKKQKNSAKITANVIDNYIKNIEKDSTIEQEKYEISVFQEKGKTIKLDIKFKELELKIEKQKAENSVGYSVSIITEKESIIFRVNYKGLEQLQNILENYELELQVEPSEDIQILEKVKQNKEETRVAEEKEKVLLLIQDVKVDNITRDNPTITVEDLEKQKNSDSLKLYENMEIKEGNKDKILIIFTDTEDEFEIDTKGNITRKPEQIANINETGNSNNQTNTTIYKYQYNNQINFDNAVSIEEFSDDNAMILNNYEEDQVNDFLIRVVERIKQVNQKQMEELGLEENENPLMKIINSLFVIPQQTQSMNTLQNSNDELQEAEINAFNEKFQNYQSTNLQGVTVKGLLTTIQLNNESQENDNRKIKEIHFDGEEYEVTDQNILLLKSTVETETAYRVDFERDEETGIIYRVVINKK